MNKSICIQLGKYDPLLSATVSKDKVLLVGGIFFINILLLFNLRSWSVSDATAKMVIENPPKRGQQTHRTASYKYVNKHNMLNDINCHFNTFY